MVKNEKTQFVGIYVVVVTEKNQKLYWLQSDNGCEAFFADKRPDASEIGRFRAAIMR